MKRIKTLQNRLLALILIVVMVIGMVPIDAFAATDTCENVPILMDCESTDEILEGNDSDSENIDFQLDDEESSIVNEESATVDEETSIVNDEETSIVDNEESMITNEEESEIIESEKESINEEELDTLIAEDVEDMSEEETEIIVDKEETEISLIVEETSVNYMTAVSDEKPNHVPTLKEDVSAEQTVVIQTGFSYQLDDLMAGKIFEDSDGDSLTYENYFYQKSYDGGETWGELTGFTAMEHGGVNSSLSNSKEGTYVYKFFAYDGKGYSEDTWTLTLKVMDIVPANINFYVGQDQNYKTHSTYPVLELYKTAGIDSDLYDYIGWYEDAEGKKQYIYDPQDYEIEDGDTKDYVLINGTKYDLYDYEKVEFTNSAFDDSDTSATLSGTTVDKYNMFYASVESGRYSTRFYGYNTESSQYDIFLGGQSMELPMEKDIYGGGGGDLYFRLISCYTTSKKVDSTYFGATDYHVEMIMPVTGSMIHSGDVYVDGNYAKYPFMSYAAGNASLYNVYAYPTDTDNYIFSQAINNTTAAGNTVVSKTVTMGTAMTLQVKVPENGDFGLYLQYNNFNTKEIEPLGDAVANGDSTKTLTYKVSKGNGNYTWRLEDPSGTYVTKAGWLKSISAATEKEITYSQYTEQKYHGFDKLGTQVDTRDEADIQVFLDHDGFMSTNNTYRVRAFRMWELINSDTANIMIEPDFHVQVLKGNAEDIKLIDGGNANDNWIDVTPTTTDIIAVNYDAIDIYTTSDDYGSHGGFFPATNPERTGVFVITNEKEGTADASVKFNGGTETDRGDKWDYNYDTWYYLNTDENPTMDFTVSGTGTVDVSYAIVATDSNLKSELSEWKSVSADENGKYFASMLEFRKANAVGGTVIIKMTDSTGTSYRLIRVAEMSISTENVSNPGEPFMAGDDIKVTFDGLYRAVNKVAGIFNPTTYYLRYNSGETQVNGTLPQYQQMDNASITLTIPEDIEIGEEGSTEYSFNNGHIFGSMYAASSPFSTLYEMTDTGVGTNFSAVGVSFVLSRLADISVTVEKKVLYDVRFGIFVGESEATGAEFILTDSEGTVQSPNENGSYTLGYGKYNYSVTYPGYVCYYGSFELSSDDMKNVENGFINKTVQLTKASENAWDGVTVSEPKKDGNGVYQIGTGAELAWFAQTVNGGTTNVSAVLTADIDLAGYNWTPIGNSSKKFAGSFDGKGHKVYNLAINYVGTSTTVPYLGLFGAIAGKSTAYVEVKCFSVQGLITMTSTKSVGNAYSAGAIGHATYANITDVHSNVDVTVKRILGNWNYVGGVVGYAANYSNIKDCSNTGTISGYKYAAGIVGGAYATTVTGCVNSGTITSETTHAAGIAALSSGTTEGCYNRGKISAGTTNVGSIVGAASSGATIKNCFNVGAVVCSGDTHGAIIGTIANANVVVSDVYYLEGTGAYGIGTVKDEETQKAVCETVEVFASEEFVGKVNTGLDPVVFKTGAAYPFLVWENHSFGDGEITTEPTCIKEGVKTFKCVEEGCDVIKTEAVAATGDHSYDEGTVTTAPTCVKEGVKTYKCLEENCDAVKTEAVAATGEHSYDEGTVTTPATCVKEGVKTYKCVEENCDAVKTEAVAATGEHSYDEGTVTKKATATANGKKTYTCKYNCGSTKKSTIYAAKTIELSTTNYTYDGKSKKPSVTVTDSKGKKLKNGTDYTVKYDSNRKEIGKHKVTVTFKGNYTGSKELYFEIGPKNPSKLTAVLYGHDDVKVSWSKVSGVTGYKIYYKKASDSVYKHLVTTTKTSCKKSGLSDGVKYTFKVVAYKKVNGNTLENSGKTDSIYTLKKISMPTLSTSGSKVKVKWININGETGYQISQSTSKSKTEVVSDYKTTSGTYKKLSATKGKTYYYKVRAYKIVDGEYIYGPWSNVKSYKR